MRKHATETETWRATDRPAHLSLDGIFDLLTVIEYGRVWDGQPSEQVLVQEEDERIRCLLDEPGGRTIVGFEIDDPFEVDVDLPDLWDGLRFNVPALGLRNAAIGEIVLAVRARYDDENLTMDAWRYHAAVMAD